MAQPQAAQENPAVRMWVAKDPQSLRILEIARKVAKTPATILIRGESGTGKDLLAQIIHLLSPAHNEPFVKIDCASLPPELVESELFGHERGAFTGADAQKHGRLELAGSGTIVLDDVASLSVAAQAKLLRVIEEKKFQRLGGTETIHIHSRLVALSNADLERAVAERTFREDLYYRLNVFPILIPPLRQRRADILPLAERLLDMLCALHRRSPATLTPKAAELLAAYDFPGNGRELKNILERAVVYGGRMHITPDDLPQHVAQNVPAARTLMSLEELEREYIAEVLDAVHGKKSEAARVLGISRKTLLEKRKRYNLD
jgi:transcriptional regulator with PAS, ATPase and Fis domain